jgi:hypothetical protein
VPELELEPVLPALPEVLGSEGLGDVVLGVLGAVVLPETLPEARPSAASFMQRSFSAPRRTAHFCVSTLAPAEPLVVLDGLVEVAGLVVCELVLALPEDWARVAPDSARSAAAVELTRIFSMAYFLLRRETSRLVRVAHPLAVVLGRTLRVAATAFGFGRGGIGSADGGAALVAFEMTAGQG